jgi:hypothetical protein
MFNVGTKLRHKKTGKVVKFTGNYKGHRGVVKVETEPLDLFGFLDVQEFEAVPEWTLKVTPEAYIKKAESGQKVKEETLALARKIVG